jgi:hypothetical protein
VEEHNGASDKKKYSTAQNDPFRTCGEKCHPTIPYSNMVSTNTMEFKAIPERQMNSGCEGTGTGSAADSDLSFKCAFD